MDVTTATSLSFISKPMVFDVKDLFQHVLEKQAPSAMEICGSNVRVLLQQAEVQAAPIFLGGVLARSLSGM